MDIIKKNLLSVIFGVIALLAVVAVFYPIGGMYTALQAGDPSHPDLPNLNAEQGNYDKINKLLVTKRPLPIMPVLGKADGGTQYLVDEHGAPIFPSDPVKDAAQAAIDKVHQEAEDLMTAAEKCENGHTPLVSGVLPDPSPTLADDFQTEYKAQLGPGGVIATKLQATWPPTDEEIKKRCEDLWTTDYFPQIYKVDNKPANDKELNAQWTEACKMVPIQMRDQLASKYKMYMNLPGALEVNQTLYTQGTPHADQLWYAQLTLWVEQDVTDAIATANASADNVSHSAVKQLIRLAIPEDAVVYVTAQDAKYQPGGAPKPDANAPSGLNFAVSPTGRVCNSLYDVVHFTLELDVDAARLPQVLQLLEKGKLITVKQVDATTVDSTAKLDDGFVYGKEPVVRVTLECEELFLRSWVDPLMPKVVKEMIHGGNANGESGGGGGGGGMMGPRMPPHHEQ